MARDLESEYNKARKNLLARVRRAEKKGYNINRKEVVPPTYKQAKDKISQYRIDIITHTQFDADSDTVRINWFQYYEDYINRADGPHAYKAKNWFNNMVNDNSDMFARFLEEYHEILAPHVEVVCYDSDNDVVMQSLEFLYKSANDYLHMPYTRGDLADFETAEYPDEYFD